MKIFDFLRRQDPNSPAGSQPTPSEEDVVAAAVNALTAEAAEQEAATYLKDPGRFRTMPGESTAGEGAYGPCVRRFFRQYQRLNSTRSEVEVEGGVPVYSQVDPSLWLIGTYGGHTEVGVVRGGDEIVVLGTEAEPEVFFRFPTIFHFICFLGRSEKQ